MQVYATGDVLDVASPGVLSYQKHLNCYIWHQASVSKFCLFYLSQLVPW